MSTLRRSPICLCCKKFLVDNLNDRHKDNEVVQLRDCSRCKFAKYCSVKCQKKDWKVHKSHCEALCSISLELNELENVYSGIGNQKEITDLDIKQILEERSISYLIKNDERFYTVGLEKYENSDRCAYLYLKLLRVRMYWYYAQVKNAYFLYERCYHLIKDIIKCCPILIDNLIYYFVMSMINLDLDDEALQMIYVWCFDFEESPTEVLVQYLKAMLDGDWIKLPKPYFKFSTTEDFIFALYGYVDCPEEENFQLLPFLPAILAIKVKNFILLNEKKKDFENFVEAIIGDNGQLKIWSECFPGIIEEIGAKLLGSNVKKFNQIMQTQIDDINDAIFLVKKWKTEDLDFLHGGICKHLPHLMKNVPRHFVWEDHSGLEKLIRIYGHFFKRLTEEFVIGFPMPSRVISDIHKYI